MTINNHACDTQCPPMENLTLGSHDRKSCKERLMKTQVWHDSLGQVWPS
jgi:hypothetical protein